MAEFDFGDVKLSGTKPLGAEEIAALVGDDQPKDEPKKTTARKSTAPKKAVGRPSKQTAQDELQEEIEGFLQIMGFTIYARDHHADGSTCAELFITPEMKLAPEAQNLAQKLAIVGVDNKYIKKFFDMGGETGKWMMLAMALQPFIVGPYINHFVIPRQVKNADRDN